MPGGLRFAATLLICWLPGLATARWCVSRSGSGLAPRALSPFPEILLSVGLSVWIGFVLAELGLFSIFRLCLLLLVYTTIVAVAAGWSWPPAPPTGRPALLSVFGVAVVVGVLYAPPFDTSIMGSDASFYLSTGAHLARRGSLAIEDPLMAELSPEQRPLLFPPNVAGGWARVPGGLLLRSLDETVVYPSFAHLLPVAIAIADALGGASTCRWLAPVFAGLALWAIWLLAAEASGGLGAALTVLLVATNLAQWFYGRFLMPEIVAEAFLWGGLLTFGLWWRDGSRATAALAALALGIAGLTRIEDLLMVPLGVMTFIAWSSRRPRTIGTFAAVYGGLVAHGLGHLLLVPTHYRDVIQQQAVIVRRSLEGLGMPVAIPAAGLGVAAVVAVVGPLRVRRGALLALGGTAAAGFVHLSRMTLSTTLVWLAESASWGVLGMAVLGLALRPWRRPAMGLPCAVLLVVGLPFLWDPHVTAVQLWGVRRFVTVVVPCVGLLAALAVSWVARRRPLVALALAGVLSLANARPVWRLRGLPFFPPQEEALRGLAKHIPDGAVVFVAPELTQYLVHLPLWLVYDREPIVLPAPAWQAAMAAIGPGLALRQPVVYLGNAFGPRPTVDGLDITPRAETQLRTLVPELDALRAPAGSTTHLVPLRIYDVAVRRAGG